MGGRKTLFDSLFHAAHQHPDDVVTEPSLAVLIQQQGICQVTNRRCSIGQREKECCLQKHLAPQFPAVFQACYGLICKALVNRVKPPTLGSVSYVVFQSIKQAVDSDEANSAMTGNLGIG